MTWNEDRERLIAAAELGDATPQVAADLLVAARKRAFEAEAAHAWIKTSERLPAHGERCLVYADFAGTVLCVIGQYIPYADSDLRPWRIHHGQERFLYAGMASIVGWQSLPEPPK